MVENHLYLSAGKKLLAIFDESCHF